MIDLSKPPQKSNAEEGASRFDTEIIRLQNYDNFYSLMDRLNQRDAGGECPPRIRLVWPAHGRVLDTPAEFGRLRGWAVRHGYALAVVIPGKSVGLKMAKEQGLPAFTSVSEAESAEWKMPRDPLSAEDPYERNRRLVMLREDAEKTRSVKAPFAVRLLFFLLAILSLAAAAFAIFPHAKVEITPYLTRKKVNMTVWTDDRLDTVTMGGGIPTIEKKLNLSLQTSVPSTGEVHIQSGIAVGEITVRNTCGRTYASTAGVRLSTDEDFEAGILFSTLEDLTLAPEEERTIRIEAVNGGFNGNLPAGSIRYAEYPKSLCWEVRQENPTQGGSEGIYAAPTDADRTIAHRNIEDMIPDAVREALSTDPEGADLLPLGEPVITAVLQEQSLPDPGFASEALTLRETLEVTIRMVRRSDMEAIIRGQASRLNAQTAGLIGYEILAGPTVENGLTRWVIEAEYLVYEPETNEEALQIMLRGKTIPQARTILNTLEHVKETKITLLPSWMPQMPLAAQNIRVIINNAAEEEKP